VASTSTAPATAAKVTEIFEKPTTFKKSIVVKVEDFLSFQGLALAAGDIVTGKHNIVDDDGGRILSFQIGLGLDDSANKKGVVSFVVQDTDIPKEIRESVLNDAVVTWKLRFNCPRRRALFFPPLGYLTTGSAHLRTHDWVVKKSIPIPEELLTEALEIRVDVELVMYNQPFKFVRTKTRDVTGNVASSLHEDEENAEYEPLTREENAHLSDVQVICDNKRFKCHKIHLSRRSNVFKAMFQHSLEESRTNEVFIDDFDEGMVASMIHFIYEGSLDNMDFDEKLLAIAEKYEIELLKQSCEASLAEQLDDSSVAGMWVVADTCNAATLKGAVIKYLCNNWERREEFDDLEKVLVQRPTLIKDILPLISIK